MFSRTLLASLVGTTAIIAQAAPMDKSDALANTPYLNQNDSGFDMTFSPKPYRTL